MTLLTKEQIKELEDSNTGILKVIIQNQEMFLEINNSPIILEYIEKAKAILAEKKSEIKKAKAAKRLAEKENYLDLFINQNKKNQEYQSEKLASRKQAKLFARKLRAAAKSHIAKGLAALANDDKIEEMIDVTFFFENGTEVYIKVSHGSLGYNLTVIEIA